MKTPAFFLRWSSVLSGRRRWCIFGLGVWMLATACATPSMPRPETHAEAHSEGPKRTDPPSIPFLRLPERVATAPYHPDENRSVALVPIKDFTSGELARVPLEEPLTATLIRVLREDAGLEVLPGFIPNARALLGGVREYLHGTVGAKFPKSAFESLTATSTAPAFLLVWLEKSGHPLVANEARETVPGGRFELSVVAVLLDREGRMLWALPLERSARVSPQQGEGYRTEAEAVCRGIAAAFKTAGH